MKKLLLFLISITTSLAANAQYRDSESLRDRLQWSDEKLHIMLDTRFDLRYEAGDIGNQFGFRGQTLRVWFEGEVIPGFRYRVRHRLNKLPTQHPDGLTDASGHAWVAFDFGTDRQWTITAGKQSVQLGTYEYDYNGADNYISTMVNSDFDGSQIGVNVAYRFLGQTLNFQVFNSASAQFATGEYINKAISGSLLWQGSFFDGLLKTRTAYTLLQHSSEKFYSWITTGWQLNTGGLTAELDYFFGDRNMDYSAMTGGEQRLSPVRDRSAALKVGYCAGKWQPFIKGIWDKRHDREADSDVYERIGIQAAVEFYPFAEHKYVNDLRFHFAYGFTSTSFRGTWSGMPDLGQHFALLGMRWFFVAK